MMSRWAIPILRRTIQMLSLLVLVLLPLLALYTHYHSARAIGDLPQGSWRSTALRQIDEFVADAPSRQKAVETTQGTFWSARLLGVSLTDPLAGLEAIVSSHAFYTPLLWSLLVPVVVSLALGRVFCGWICPMNTLLELVDKCRRWLGVLEIRERDVRFSKWTKYFVLAASLGLVAMIGIPFLAMVYPPAVISREIHLLVFGTGLGLGAYLILTICAFELFVSRRWWCRYICPGGAVYSLLGRFRLVRIRRDKHKCIECGDCVRTCQFDLRPMLVETTGMECTNCASCIQVCDSRALSYSIVLPKMKDVSNDDQPDEDKSPVDKHRGSSHQPVSRSLFATVALFVIRHLPLLAFLAMLLTPQPALGHHILGLPHYSYKENYPQAPTLEYPAATGPYDVLMTSYPGRPIVGEAATVCFYIKNRDTNAPYDRPVTMRVLRTATFGANSVIYPPATHQPFDNQHKYTVTFPAESEYIVELTMDVEGRAEVIPFLVVVGTPTATTSIIVTILVSLAVFIVVVRAIKKKRDRRKASAGNTTSSRVSSTAAPSNVGP